MAIRRKQSKPVRLDEIEAELEADGGASGTEKPAKRLEEKRVRPEAGERRRTFRPSRAQVGDAEKK
jgi:hypothetical protein